MKDTTGDETPVEQVFDGFPLTGLIGVRVERESGGIDPDQFLRYSLFEQWVAILRRPIQGLRGNIKPGPEEEVIIPPEVLSEMRNADPRGYIFTFKFTDHQPGSLGRTIPPEEWQRFEDYANQAAKRAADKYVWPFQVGLDKDG